MNQTIDLKFLNNLLIYLHYYKLSSHLLFILLNKINFDIIFNRINPLSLI